MSDGKEPEPTRLDRRDFLKVAGAQAGMLIAGACATGSSSAANGASSGGVTSAASQNRAPAIGGRSPDVAVIGAGAFGGWTAYNLRRMGARVTLIDTWGPGNSRATSGDETRGVRTSYGDRPHGELWVRWASEAIERWKAWDEEWAQALSMRLFFTTGDLILRKDWEPYMKDTRAHWDKVGVRYEVLEPNEVRYRWPVIGLKEIGAVLYEPDAGVVRSRRACEVVAEVFRRNGGEITVARALPSLASERRLHDLSLSTKETLSAGQFVFACGPWLWKLFPEILRTRLRTPMGHVYYYGTPVGDDRFTWPNLPSYSFPGITGWPSLPNDNRGFRVRTGGGAHSDPDHSQRWIDPSNFTRPRAFLIDRFPLLIDAPLLETRACHYEITVTRNFYIDRHPEWENVWIAGGGSAEAFKFGPVLGEYIAKRVMGDEDDPAIAAGFRIPKEEFEETPPPAARDSTKADSTKAASDSAKVKADSAKADSARRVQPAARTGAAPARRP